MTSVASPRWDFRRGEVIEVERLSKDMADLLAAHVCEVVRDESDDAADEAVAPEVEESATVRRGKRRRRDGASVA